MTIESKDRVIANRCKWEQRSIPREKILLYALRRELGERGPDDLNCCVIRRLVIETFRAISLDY